MDKNFSNLILDSKILLSDIDSSILKVKEILKSYSALEDPKDANELNLTQIVVGSNVKWDNVTGTVVQLYKRHIFKVINDEPYSIEGSIENPALLIKDAEGNEFLKLATDVSLYK